MPEFAILAPDGSQIVTWMKCKDYIQDTIWGSMNNKYVSIYGWRYNPNKDPKPSSRYLLLALRWVGRDSEMETYLYNVQETVEDLESRLRIPKVDRTRFSRASGDKFVIYGSNKWKRCAATVSFFTFLIRASLTNSGGKLETIGKKTAVGKDAYYIKSGAPFIKRLLSKGFLGFKPDWHKECSEEIHDSGFVNYSGRL